MPSTSRARCFAWPVVRASTSSSSTHPGSPRRAPQVTRRAATLSGEKEKTHGHGGGSWSAVRACAAVREAVGLVGAAPVSGCRVPEGFDAGQPCVGDGWALLAEHPTGAAGEVQRFHAVASACLELGERAYLVRGQQRVLGSACGLTAPPYQERADPCSPLISREPAREGGGLAAHGGQPRPVRIAGRGAGEGRPFRSWSWPLSQSVHRATIETREPLQR